jgi:hypothetical protein
MKRIVLALAATTAVLAGSAFAGKKLDYAAYAGEPVKEIRYYQLYNWQRSTNRRLVLWTKPSTAYMLELKSDCFTFGSPRAVIEIGGVAAVKGRLQVNDQIRVGEISCRVQAIRPIDLEAMKRDRTKA